MTQSNRPDAVRAALARVERAERRHKFGLVLVALAELLFGGAYLVLMDFRDRLHWLILLAACLVYSIILIGVVNLGAYVQSATQALLNAILAGKEEAGGTP